MYYLTLVYFAIIMIILSSEIYDNSIALLSIQYQVYPQQLISILPLLEFGDFVPLGLGGYIEAHGRGGWGAGGTISLFLNQDSVY